MPLTWHEHATNAFMYKDCVQKLLVRFGHYLHWSESKEMICDVGCGEGMTMLEALYPYIKNHIDQLYGLDMSRIMLNEAVRKCKYDNVIFREFNLATIEVDEDLRGKFDKVFSFFCVQYIPNKRVWIRNCQRLLKHGGQIFIAIPCLNPFQKAVKALSANTSWKAFVETPPKNPYSETGITQILEKELKIGYNVNRVTPVPHILRFDSYEELKEYATSVSLVPKGVPHRLHKSYQHDFMKELLRDKETCKCLMTNCLNPGNSEEYHLKQIYILAVATKKRY